MGLYYSWKFRAYIRITNPAGVANYQHKITVPWMQGMRNDFRDLRFATIDGLRCRYWIESSTSKSTATVWVKVPTAGQAGIFLHYGNNSCVSESSGADTFDFFEDFGAALDFTTKWSGDSANLSVSGGIGTLTSPDTGTKKIYSQATFGTNTALRTRAAMATASNEQSMEIGFESSDRANKAEVYKYISGSYANFKGETKTGGSTTTADSGLARDASYHIFEVRRNASTSVIAAIDTYTATPATNIPTGSLPVMLFCYYTSATITADWILVRKFQATEPTTAIIWHGPMVNSKSIRMTYAGTLLYTGTEYAFDPVNVNHGMSPGVGATEIAMTNNIAHGMAGGVGIVEYDLGAININHPMYPTATWAQIIDPVVDSGYLIGVTVSQSMDDAMAEAVFEYDTDAIGNYFSGDYMTQVHVNIPDYLGVSNCVFVGLVPSSRGVYDVAKDKMTMRAVDYGIFLAKQTMAIKDLSLLPPDDQTAEGANIAKVLSYRNRVKPFQIGMTIRGKTSDATGTIDSIAGTSSQILTLYPASGVFVDGENLLVGGVVHAIADGRSLDVPYTAYYHTISPEDWVQSILGGDNWMRTCGIEPYVLESSSGYWDTDDCPAVPFMFGSLEKKRDGLLRVAKYMVYMWHIKPRSIGTGSYRSSGYFIKETSIDTLLDLPAAASITSLDDITNITIDQDGEMQVDVVKVRCQDLEGNWKDAIKSNSYYDAGEGPYREFSDEPKDIATQTDLNEYALDMYNLYSGRSVSWSGTLLARSDLQLYQLLNISGCIAGGIPNGTYRIIKKVNEFGCAKNLTHVTFMLSTLFSILRKYGMTYKDSISKVEQIVNSMKNQDFQIELGYVKATDGWSVTYETEAGNKGKGRDGTSTPDVAGSIPIGAKIQIQNSRGGVICIPVVAASGATTDLLTVDVPTIVSAVVDPNNHNYWFLQWTPGVNNQNVSINAQITSYPSSHGVVTGPGSTTKLVSVITRALRIRFSGPLTTYYIKIWGEKNGVYSATGATATITSGSDVTIGSDEEPEAFKQVASLDVICNIETNQWFNTYSFYKFPAGTYKLELWGWIARSPDLGLGWYEETGQFSGKHGVESDILHLMIGDTDTNCYIYQYGARTASVFAHEDSYLCIVFTIASDTHLGLYVYDLPGTGWVSDNFGEIFARLTQL